MDLIEHYNKLYKESIQKIRSDEYQTDVLMDASDDNRRGITLVIRPDLSVKDKIQTFLTDLKVIEPEQYYYPNTDMHITLMAVISCNEGFGLSQISIPDYIEVIQKSLVNQKPVTIDFKGITASSSCIMVQGFMRDDILNDIRDQLRINFRNSGLQQTIDARYSIQTAHATVVRFRKRFTRKDDFIKVLERYRNFEFGKFTVNNVELVYNDWYQKNENVKTLSRFKLK